jgi:hypothetical protein
VEPRTTWKLAICTLHGFASGGAVEALEWHAAEGGDLFGFPDTVNPSHPQARTPPNQKTPPNLAQELVPQAIVASAAGETLCCAVAQLP